MFERDAVFCCVAGFVLAALPGCSAVRAGSGFEAEIRETLARQDQAWNAGDVEAFMDAYWRSGDLTFSSGGKVTRGWQQTLDGYRNRYPDRAAMGKLSFSDLEVTAIGPESALVLGRWHLDRSNPTGGVFTLVMRKDEGRWVIVHDHTSRGEE